MSPLILSGFFFRLSHQVIFVFLNGLDLLPGNSKAPTFQIKLVSFPLHPVALHPHPSTVVELYYRTSTRKGRTQGKDHE